MLQNLKAEMTRRSVGSSDIGRVIGKSTRTATDKVSGRYPFTINEAKTIRDAFFQGMDLEFLFAETRSDE